MTLRLLHLPQLEAHPQGDRDDDYPQTEESVQAAQLAQWRERREALEVLGPEWTFAGDRLVRRKSLADVAVAMGNWIASACYGPRGELRK